MPIWFWVVGLAGHCGGCCYGHPDGGQSVLMPCGVCCSSRSCAEGFSDRVPGRRC